MRVHLNCLLAITLSLILSIELYSQVVIPYLDYTVAIKLTEIVSVEDEYIRERMQEEITGNSDISEENLSEEDIERLANNFGLLNEIRMNPGLRFQEGDISYWYEQGLSRTEYELEFLARKIVLEAAAENEVNIGDSGELSAAAQDIMFYLVQEKRVIDDPSKLQTAQQEVENHLDSPPVIRDPNNLSRYDIRKLAHYYGLQNISGINTHLSMREGDISYWYEQHLTADALKLKFRSRQMVLELAEQNNETIQNQGVLSSRAEEIERQLIQSNQGN